MIYNLKINALQEDCNFVLDPVEHASHNCSFGDDMSSVNNQVKCISWVLQHTGINSGAPACLALLEPVDAEVQRGRFLFFHQITQALF